MKILLLGSYGFVGKYFSKLSLHKKNLIITSHKKKIKFDITKDDIEKLYLKYNFDKIVLLSAKSNPFECKHQRNYAYNVNVKSSKKIINFCIKKNIYFIFFSSEYIFSGNKKKYTERSNPKTRMIYGNHKIIIEKFLKKKKYKKFSILRLSKTFGDQINDGSLFSKYLKEYLKGQRIFEIAKDQIFNPLYVKDLVKIIDYFLKNNISGTYNVGGKISNSRYNLVKLFFKYLKIKNVNFKKNSISKYDKNIYIPKNVSFDITKLKKTIDFELSNFPTNLINLKNVYKK